MESTDLQQTIRNAMVDAQLVVDYSARAGLLRENDPLVVELHNLTDALEKDRAPFIGNLLHALSDSLNAISVYTSLVELREGYSPFSWCYKILHPDAKQQTIVERFVSLRVRLSIMLPFLFLVVASVSSFLLIDRYRDTLEVLKKVDAVERTEPLALIERIVRQVKDDDGSARSMSDFEANMELLRRALKEAKDFSSYEYELKDDATLASFGAFVADRLHFSTSATETMSDSETPAELPVVPLPAEGENGGASAMSLVSPGFQCDALRKRLAAVSGAVRATVSTEYTACIEHALFLDRDREVFDDVSYRAAVLRNKAYRLVAWYIPLSVGFLGAAIYLLYIRNYRRPFFSIQRTLLRFALGGVAGVLIAWIYPPARISATDLDVMDSVRQFPFMFAFLAGFGADSVFTFLTKKVEAFGGGTDKHDAHAETNSRREEQR